VRTIGDILVLSDVIDPFAYLALPYVNQAFYVAGCCYMKGEFDATLFLWIIGARKDQEVISKATKLCRICERGSKRTVASTPLGILS
jgi:hypothetical protein